MSAIKRQFDSEVHKISQEVKILKRPGKPSKSKKQNSKTEKENRK